MATRLQIRRGLASTLPVLAEGEPGFTTDSKEFYVGSSTGNIQLSKKADLDAHVSATIAHAWGQIGETPNTLEDYGITDAYTKTAIDAALALKAPIANPSFTGNVGIDCVPSNYNAKFEVRNNNTDGTGGILVSSYMPTVTMFDMSGSQNSFRIAADGNKFTISTDSTKTGNGTWSDLVQVTSSGNVGINNTSPGHPLSIGNADVFGLRRDSSDTSIRFGDNSGWKFHIGRAKEASGGAVNTGSTGALVTVEDNGNVGIGTLNPAEKLHLRGGVLIDSAATSINYNGLTLDYDLTNRIARVAVGGTSGANGDLAFITPAGGVELERMRINYLGNVGIGGAPIGKLHVVDGGTTSTVICLIEADDNNPWHLSLTNKTFTSSPSRGFNFIQENGGAGNIYVDNKSMLQINPASMYITPGLVDNAVSCGSSSVRWSGVWAVAGTIQTSDERAKNSITDSDLGLDFISQLRPVGYKFNVRLNEVTKEPDGTETVVVTPAVLDEDGNEITPAVTEERQKYKEVVTPLPGIRTHYGMIAQQVQQVLNGKDFAGFIYDQETDSYGLRYEEFIGPLIKAVQELKAIVDAQAAEIEQLKSGA